MLTKVLISKKPYIRKGKPTTQGGSIVSGTSWIHQLASPKLWVQMRLTPSYCLDAFKYTVYRVKWEGGKGRMVQPMIVPNGIKDGLGASGVRSP